MIDNKPIHKNTRMPDEQIIQACYTVQQRGDRVTIQRVREELGGKGSAEKVARIVREFNQRDHQGPSQQAAALLDETKHFSNTSIGAMSQVMAGLEATFTDRERQLESEYVDRRQTLELEYQQRLAELDKQQNRLTAERLVMQAEIDHLRSLDTGKSTAIENYVNQLRALEQKRIQAESQLHAMIEKNSEKEAKIIELKNELGSEKQRQSQLINKVTEIVEEKYADKVVVLELRIKGLEEKLDDANASYEKDTALWMNKYDATRIERDNYEERYTELKQKQFKVEDNLSLNKAALTEKILENNFLKDGNSELKSILDLLKSKDKNVKFLIKTNKQLLRKLVLSSKIK
uniref:DNA-binding protein n=1 Tax=Piscirickettsia salmonis TaxID=1238 RepID=UPI0039F72D33